jgi:hypothetical protein
VSEEGLYEAGVAVPRKERYEALGELEPGEV